ncbi:glutamyl-tRNA reductase [Geothrix rubra]|uniref:Glutamyl-tRNA reductase n=1 Tax=Geothrix rubra TaxID=2927977 RepID=A0ABQ5Q9Q9_9BACT|nr:glutamyl-tRNA reductase [Geothrix rubra]GLH71160.1 glutamyl-tRNA reductase [Geothrix rubra]
MSHPDESPLLLVGWDFRQTPVELRERLAFSPEKIEAAILRLREEGLLSEGVIVSTCNRSEVYGVRGPAAVEGDPLLALTGFVSEFHGLPRHEIESVGYRHMGADAVRHLFRVTAGLESLALGEHQIIGQVREAFRFASSTGLTRTVLNRLFQKAIEAGKRVRNETGLNSRPISIPGVAIELAQKIYEDLAPRRFLILGAGETSSIFFDLLVARGARHIEVVNRTLEKAEALCQRAGKAYPWEQLASRIPHVDVVVSATSATEPVITREDAHRAVAQRRGQPLFFLDLGIPRNVDPKVADLDNAFLYAVDDLQEIAERNRQERQREVVPAMAILEEELQDFTAWYGSLAVVPTITALRRKFESIREAEFDRSLEKLNHLSPGDREKIRLMAQSMVRSLLRRPTEALKETDDPTRRLERAEAAQYLFDLDIDPKD